MASTSRPDGEAVPPTEPPATGFHAGTWEGEYLDTNGYRGRLRLTMDAAGDAIRGQYELTIRTEDAPQVLRGELQGRAERDRLRLSLPLGKERTAVDFDVQLRPAGSYARQAMIGIVGQVPGTNFGGGVWIAWHFASQPSRAR